MASGRRRRQRDGVIQSVVVIHKQGLPSFHDRQAVVTEHRAGRVGASRVLRLPSRVFPLVEHVFRIGERGHPTSAAQRCIPARVVDM